MYTRRIAVTLARHEPTIPIIIASTGLMTAHAAEIKFEIEEIRDIRI